jgi:4-diphosphocytidyl-2-C-methyl-D-erythritol kinase
MGRGEILEEIDIDLSSYSIVLVNPGIHINTGHAFSQLTPAVPKCSVSKIIKQPVLTWKDELKNDFEKPVFETYPQIKEIKSALYDSGALYAAMSGSGSTVFGIFSKNSSIPRFPPNYFTRLL